VVAYVAHVWRDERDRVREAGEAVTEALKRMARVEAAPGDSVTLDITVTASEMRLYRARRALQRWLEERT